MKTPRITFASDWFAEIESAPGRMSQRLFRQGATVAAVVRPVAPGKVVDLVLADGGVVRGVPAAKVVAATAARAA